MPMLTDLASKLRAYTASDGSKLTIVEVSGWQSRGYAGQGMSSASGHMWHHTATAESAFSYSDIPTLNLLTNGRSDLPGPLCNIALGRSGTVYVIAAGVANHAGTGSASGLFANVGNHHIIGNEMESSGIRDDWTAAQRRVMPHLGAALEQGYGDRNFLQIAHKEYSNIGKIDPAYIDMDALRGEINTMLYEQPTASTTAGATTEKDWLEMATEKDVENAAYRAAVNALNERFNAPFVRQGPSAKEHYGERTTTLNSVVRWTDEAWQQSRLRDEEIEKKVDELTSLVKGLAVAPDGEVVQAGGLTVAQLQEIVAETVRAEIDRTKLGAK